MSRTPCPITFEDVLAARERLRPHLPPTPLRHDPSLDRAVGQGVRVLVKHENHHPTNSFKVRIGVAALTALAWAGRRLGVPVVVCVPRGNNPEKNEAICDLGAELVEEGEHYDHAIAVMHRIAGGRGLCPVHSTNEPNVLAGAGTMALEILEQTEAIGERVDAMVFALGGGSQAVGAMTVLRRLRPDVPVYAVGAERAPAQHDAWHAGRPLTSDTADTFADGIATRSTYELTFDALREGLAGFVLASEDEIADALRAIIRTTHNLTEGAGATGLAGLRKLAPALAGKTVAIALSGSNIDQQTLQRLIQPAADKSPLV